jgi:Ca2+-binding RTX toxin-like protein
MATPMVWKSETQVNTADGSVLGGGTNLQYNPHITALQDGGYLVVWVDGSRTHFNLGSAIVGQRYDHMGVKVGGEIDLSQPAEAAGVESFGEPSVTVLDDGNVAVAFSVSKSGGAKEVYAEVYTSDFVHVRQVVVGTPQGFDPSIVPLSGEYFATTYARLTGDAYFRQTLIDAGGGGNAAEVELGASPGPIHPDDGAPDSQYETAIVRTPDGGHFVVYQDRENAGANHDIWYEVFDAAGATVSYGQVANAAGVNETKADVAVNADGEVMIVWQAPDSDGGTDIFTSRRSATGVEIESGSLFFAPVAGNQHDARVVALDDGNFLVLWSDDSYINAAGQNTGAIKARRVGFDEEFVISETCTALGFVAGEEVRATQLSDGRTAIVTNHATLTDFDIVTSIWDFRESLITGKTGTITSRPDGAMIIPGEFNNITLVGLDGPDIFYVGPQGSGRKVHGGGGNDTFFLEGSMRHLELDGGAGTDRIQVLGSSQVSLNSIGVSIEQWVGNGAGIVAGVGQGGASDINFSGLTLVSNFGIMSGGGNNDKFIGTRFNDVMTGDGENDTLNGFLGNDNLNGGADLDTLIGGMGRDILTGGTHKDIFDFNATNESVKGANRDQIKDFNRAQGDKIDLSTIDADTSANPGNDKFKFIGAAAFSGGGGEVRLSGKILHIDVNDGLTDMEISLNVATITAADFIL